MRSDYYSLVKVLERIARFFEQLSQPNRGEYFNLLAGMIREGRYEEAIEELTGLRLWGGAGSYVDLVLYPKDGFVFGEEDFGRINAEYCSLLLDLLTQLERIAPRSWMGDMKDSLIRLKDYYSAINRC
ncbi:MAG: hypothetical protein WHS44_08025 [Fimbriimonadales bacterium]|nr:MAG: hypothetical protein KatS3mg018_0434 [Fimbriimonadales bacterium]